MRINHLTKFVLNGLSYYYDAECIQAYKDNKPITLDEFIEAYKASKELGK